MRKFSNQNKTTFGIFGGIIAVALAGMSALVISSSKSKEAGVDIYGGSILYTSDSRAIEIQMDSTMTKKWDGSYHYKNEDGKDISAGEHPIVYNDDENTLSIYGSCYRIYPDGSVKVYPDGVEIDSFRENAVYKLDDRLYVMTGNVVQSFDKRIATDKFIRVKIDINGGCMMQSMGLSNKSINPVILVSGNLFFDVASELLYSDGLDFNMRKVIGSTNTYEDAPYLYSEEIGIARPQTSVANTRTPDVEEYNITAGHGGNGGDGGNGADGGKGGTGGTGGLGGTGGFGGNAATTKQDETIIAELKSVDSTTGTITVNYNIYEGSNNVQKASLIVTDLKTNEAVTHDISKTAKSYTIYGLEQNKQYNVKMVYHKYVVDEATKSWIGGPAIVVNDVNVWTKNSSAKATTVSSTRNTDNKVDTVTANLKLSGYTVDTDSSATYRSYVVVRFKMLGGATQDQDYYLTEDAMASAGQNIVISVPENTDQISFVVVKGYNGANAFDIPVSYTYKVNN